MVLKRNCLRILTVILIAAAFVAVAMPLVQEEAHAKVSKSVTKKAKAYKKAKNKLFKVGKAWYCFSKKKVKTGLQKVGKEYYFFNKSNGKMLTKSGLRKVGSAYYFFSKKSGKAPALRNKAKAISGEVWFFQKDGKRYNYAFGDTGSAAGNDAAGYIIAKAGIRADGTASEDQLKEAYAETVKYKYLINLASEPSDIGEIGKLAKSIVDNNGGKCYNHAALTYVTLKALGASPVYCSGTFQRNPEARIEQHAWVTLSGENGAEYAFDSNQESLYLDEPSSTGYDFFSKKITYQDDSKASFKIEGCDFMYYPAKTIK